MSSDGEYVEWHPTGQVLRRGKYAANVPVGAHVFRAPDGRVYGSSTIVAGSGYWREFYPNGKRRMEGRYERGKRVGKWLTYYDSGAVKERITYRAGQPDGPYRAYYKSGEKLYVGAYKKGLARWALDPALLERAQAQGGRLSEGRPDGDLDRVALQRGAEGRWPLPRRPASTAAGSSFSPAGRRASPAPTSWANATGSFRNGGSRASSGAS